MRSERLLKKRRRRIIFQTTLSVFGLVLLVALPALLSHLSAIQIQTVTVVNDGVISENSVKSIVQEQIAGSYFYLFSRSNIFFYPKKNIKNILSGQFTRIKDVSLRMKSMKEIEIAIVERSPDALWCREGRECYFLDEAGLIFDRAPEFTDNVYIEYAGSISGEPLGAQYLAVEEFNKVKEIIAYVKLLSLSPSTLAALGDHEYSLKLSGGEYIFFTTRDSITQSVSNLESILSDSKLSLRLENGLSVSSLDLRYGNKVFFKRKNGESGSAVQ